MKRLPAQAGMTLVELVVALGLLALVVGSLAAALGVSARGSVAIESKVEQGEALRVAQQTLRRYLSQARPVRTLVGQREQAIFVGEAEAVGFVGVMPPWPSGGGLYRVLLSVEDTGAGRALTLTRQVTVGEAPSFEFGASADRAVLLSGISALRWSYYGVDPSGRQGSWRPSWRGERELPRLVRLEIAFVDPTAPAWPPLIVQLPLDQGPR